MLTIRELYQEVILDHNKKPHNYYVMQGANKMAQGHNPLCGDQLTLYLKVQDQQITEASFQGTGCAISTASASLMTDFLRDKTTQEANELFDKIHALLTGRLSSSDLQTTHQKLAVLAGVRDFPMRIKCATLAWHTLNAALNDEKNIISTE